MIKSGTDLESLGAHACSPKAKRGSLAASTPLALPLKGFAASPGSWKPNVSTGIGGAAGSLAMGAFLWIQGDPVSWLGFSGGSINCGPISSTGKTDVLPRMCLSGGGKARDRSVKASSREETFRHFKQRIFVIILPPNIFSINVLFK